MQVTSQGETQPERAVGPDGAGEGLDGHVGDAEEDAGRGAEHHAVVLVGVEGRREHEEGAEREQRGLEGDHADRASSRSWRPRRRAG